MNQLENQIKIISRNRYFLIHIRQLHKIRELHFCLFLKEFVQHLVSIRIVQYERIVVQFNFCVLENIKMNVMVVNVIRWCNRLHPFVCLFKSTIHPGINIARLAKHTQNSVIRQITLPFKHARFYSFYLAKLLELKALSIHNFIPLLYLSSHTHPSEV